MPLNFKYISVAFGFLLSALSCSYDTGNLEVIGDMPTSLKEVSALEIVPNSNYFWVIEDSGNRPIVFGLDSIGNIKHSIEITNAGNRDWEDLTSDKAGNLYVGDFGNNRRSRKDYSILKISTLNKFETKADLINFRLPENEKPLDFEAFFILDNMFYIFSKDDHMFKVFRVPNHLGYQMAELHQEYKLEGKHNAITSADISEDGRSVLLLNHAKLWELTNFKGNDFFSGTIRYFNFNHASQKEGVCYGQKNRIYLNDENSGLQGGNIYTIPNLKFK